MGVTDLAWSPTGEYVLAGSMDNAARVFSAVDGETSPDIALFMLTLSQES